MFCNKKILAIIPARGGSKGIPHKNIIPLSGKPLIAWTIDSAINSAYIDRTIVSSDDASIINISKKFGCDVPFIRPEKFSTDTASTADTVLHALSELPGYDYFILLQPTSPLRTTNDIDESLKTCIGLGSKSLVSVVISGHKPYLAYKKNQHGYLEPIFDTSSISLRRQDLPTTYTLNGAIYIGSCRDFMHSNKFIDSQTLPFVMAARHSVDIDSMDDLKMCEYYLNSK